MAKGVGRRREEWGTFVLPKEHLLSALVRQLQRPQRFYGKLILIGSATDPYQPTEARLKLTRSVLEIFLKMAPKVRIGILTRSPLVLRDAPLLHRLNAEVGMSISIMREGYFRSVEPVSPPPRIRLNVLRMLMERDVKTYAFVAPVFPDAHDELCWTLSKLKGMGVPVRYVELLSPFKNPLLRKASPFRRWISLIRRPDTFARFSRCVRLHYPEAHIIRHGWASA